MMGKSLMDIYIILIMTLQMLDRKILTDEQPLPHAYAHVNTVKCFLNILTVYTCQNSKFPP